MPEPDKDDIYIGGKEKAHIVIVDHDLDWAQKYRYHEEKIRQALGDAVLLIEHIGSTSVPGLAAKPIVDLLVVVADSSNEAGYRNAMEEAGYLLRIREPDWHQHRMFRTPEKDVHVHFYSEGCIEIDRVLAFRDWLRSHPEDCRRYENVKRKLAEQDWECGDDYARAKTEIIEEILRK